jgi:hypothetical protein
MTVKMSLYGSVGVAFREAKVGREQEALAKAAAHLVQGW